MKRVHSVMELKWKMGGSCLLWLTTSLIVDDMQCVFFSEGLPPPDPFSSLVFLFKSKHNTTGFLFQMELVTG